MASISYIPDDAKTLCPEPCKGPLEPGTVRFDVRIFGFKQLMNCEETRLSALLNKREPLTPAHCYAGVEAFGTIVHPNSEIATPCDLRTDKIGILRMWTHDGVECSSGHAYRFGKKYYTGNSYELHDWHNLSTNDVCVPGFHFWPTNFAAGPKPK